MRFGDILKELRFINKVTINELALLSNVPAMRLVQLELHLCEVGPSAIEIEKIAEVLTIERDYAESLCESAVNYVPDLRGLKTDKLIMKAIKKGVSAEQLCRDFGILLNMAG